MKLFKSSKEVPQNIPVPKEESARKGILIVDDSKFSRNILRDILKNEGYLVVGEANDGLEAIEMAGKLKPEFIFMDVEMPKLDGLSAISRILQIDPDIQIIMCTAMGQKSIIVEAVKIGAKDYVLKPYKKENIKSVLNSQMETKKNNQVIPFNAYKKQNTYEDHADEISNNSNNLSAVPNLYLQKNDMNDKSENNHLINNNLPNNKTTEEESAITNTEDIAEDKETLNHEAIEESVKEEETLEGLLQDEETREEETLAGLLPAEGTREEETLGGLLQDEETGEEETLEGLLQEEAAKEEETLERLLPAEGTGEEETLGGLLQDEEAKEEVILKELALEEETGDKQSQKGLHEDKETGEESLESLQDALAENKEYLDFSAGEQLIEDNMNDETLASEERMKENTDTPVLFDEESGHEVTVGAMAENEFEESQEITEAFTNETKVNEANTEAVEIKEESVNAGDVNDIIADRITEQVDTSNVDDEFLDAMKKSELIKDDENTQIFQMIERMGEANPDPYTIDYRFLWSNRYVQQKKDENHKKLSNGRMFHEVFQTQSNSEYDISLEEKLTNSMLCGMIQSYINLDNRIQYDDYLLANLTAYPKETRIFSSGLLENQNSKRNLSMITILKISKKRIKRDLQLNNVKTSLYSALTQLVQEKCNRILYR